MNNNNNNPHTLWGTEDIMSHISKGQTEFFLGYRQDEKFKKNIYHCGIKNIFADKKVKEIYFLSTSLWWGHSSLSPKFMVTEGLDWLDNLCVNARKVNIIVNTNLEKLQIKSSKDNWGNNPKLDGLGKTLCEVFNNPNKYEIRYSKLIKPTSYLMFVVFEDSYGRERACKINFHNPLSLSKCHALKFTGKVEISRISKIEILDLFFPFWNLSRPLKDVINELPKKVKDRQFYLKIVDEYKPQITTLKVVFKNNQWKKWLEKLDSGINDYLEGKYDSSIRNLYCIFDAFSQIYLNKKGSYRLIKEALNNLGISQNSIEYITGALRIVRNKDSHGQTVPIYYDKEKAFRIMIETLDKTFHTWSQSVA